jgi:hypothetical protein
MMEFVQFLVILIIALLMVEHTRFKAPAGTFYQQTAHQIQMSNVEMVLLQL